MKDYFSKQVSFRVQGIKKTGQVVGESEGIAQVWVEEEGRSYWVEQKKLKIICLPPLQRGSKTTTMSSVRILRANMDGVFCRPNDKWWEVAAHGPVQLQSPHRPRSSSASRLFTKGGSIRKALLSLVLISLLVLTLSAFLSCGHSNSTSPTHHNGRRPKFVSALKGEQDPALRELLG